MDPMRILEKATKRYTLDHLKNDQVEAVSVLALDELDALIASQVKERTSQLAAELKHVRTRLQELEKEQNSAGGLERAAADAALEAEAKALEAKAAAELRAEQAESRARDLERQLEAGAAAPKDDGRAAELEGKVAALEGELAGARSAAGEVDALRAKLGTLEADLKKAKEAAGESGGPAEPVTPDDHKKARRLVDALLDDVIAEDEARARSSFAKKSFMVDFKKELDTARKQYVKRVKAAVRGDQDHWTDAIEARQNKG